jgi:pSer/pThr/pTyr-binding forkhead associated (FHA) protein
MRAIPDPGTAPSAFVKTRAPGGNRPEHSSTPPAAPRLRETSVPAWAARVIVLDAPPVTIGRSISNRIVLPEDPVSADHCRIERDGDSFRLIDLGSTNKTWVNDHAVEDVVLRDGDLIRVGHTKFVFEWARDGA